jgi:hypothetical protein
MTTRTDQRTDVLAAVLDRVGDAAFVDATGFALHVPMGAEALSALDADAQVEAWADRFLAANPVGETPPASRPIDSDDEDDWRAALGDFSRVGDWAVLFDHELDTHFWTDVLRTWLPRLLPGAGGGLTHGLLRTAHAVRALPGDGSLPDPFGVELASGLASWAGWWRPLPGSPALDGTRSLTEATVALPRPAEPWSPIEAGSLMRIGEVEEYPAAVEALGPPRDADADAALSNLTATFARVMVANPGSPAVGLVHALTPTAAVRTLLPFLGDAAASLAYAQLWQVSAGLVVGMTPPMASADALALPEDRVVPTPDALRARAVEHGDVHAIKYTEACLREHHIRPDAAYLLAADDLLGRLPKPAHP